ncbi:sugar phosphate isomerase/epimerase [Streptomyces sp. ST2-7A]|uniref:sugar phosphate isomerase/epimerase family protein n=1 Tax=Streptomyces sp. ST2-7A TaxID=2907214 RepID=UPI001F35C880|nr:sugar phosphate isomerase/epimerase [Streptomyces sp. ST2-7A]MCE7079449.1 sugar phosphate isomerase/epimerase [Streptomyces sp. ST2-7A]
MCYGFDGRKALERSLAERGTSRRNLLRGALAGLAGAGALAAGVGAPLAHAAGRPTGRPVVPPGLIGIQLYTLRSVLGGENFEPGLRQLADIGYRRVELAGLAGRTAGEVRALLDDIGLAATSGHDGLSTDPAALETKIADAVTLGRSHLVVPYLASSSRARWQAWAEQINREAAAARAAGLRYGYHNHAHEWTTDLGGGVTPWDVLTSECDPDLVHLEIDLYWVVTAAIQLGEPDPECFAIDVIRDAPQRVRQFHVKDRAAADGATADLGTGIIDFRRIFRAHSPEEYIVENDNPEVTPMTTARVGYSYLRGLRY